MAYGIGQTGIAGGTDGAMSVQADSAAAQAVPVAIAQIPAQDDEIAGAPFSLRQAIEEALRRNPAVAAADADVAAAGFQRDAAEWARFPTPSAQVLPRVSGGAQAANSTVVRLDQPIWAGGRIDGQIDAARAQERAAQFGQAETRRRIAEQAAVAYVAWLRAGERLRLAHEGVALLDGLLGYVKRREAAGAGARSDVSLAMVRRAQALQQRQDYSGQLERARAELQAIVVNPLGRGIPVEIPEFRVASVEDTERAYLAGSSTAPQRAADVEAAQAAALVRRGAMLPKLSLRMEHLRSDGVTGGTSAQDTRVGFVLEFAPDAGLASYSGFQAAQSRIALAQAQQRADELDTRLRARATRSDYVSASQQIAEIEPQVTLLETSVQSFMRQFEVGRKTWIDVLNINREWIDARLNLSRLRSLREQSALRLMGNTGGMLQWMETLPR